MPASPSLRFAVAFTLASLLPAQAPGASIDYAATVAPLLQQRCGDCHLGARARAGLRLDRRAAILKGGRHGPAAVPGDGAGSLLVQKLHGAADGKPMPLDRPPLTAAEIATLQAWIDQGLPMPGADGDDDGTHWSYLPLQAPPRPKVVLSAWCREDLDWFVLAALERQGLQPSPECDRATWLRRASLDLCGLPPTPAAVAAFVADARDDAYERQVDRLLASPAYGERQAQLWLDLARYADSQGYEKDDLRPGMWRYRDEVIDAFSRDQPFDQFTIEQLAGDLLPDATLAQRVATAFHRQTMTNSEGGTDDEEFRTAALIDRVNTTMSVWMGSTLGCAQCHDHKYDPFTQQEYYQLLAFFDQTADRDQPDESPTLRAPTAAMQTAATALRRQIAELQAQLAVDDDFVGAWAQQQRQRMAALAAGVQQSDWRMLGPFAGSDFHAAFTATRLPDLAAAGFEPKPQFGDGQLHEWRGDNAAVYLHRRIHAEQACSAVLALGSDDGVVVWCNGVELLRHEVGRPAAPDQETVAVALQAGWNDVVLAIVNGSGPSGFWYKLRAARLDDAAEAALRQDGITDALRQACERLSPELEEVRAAIHDKQGLLEQQLGPQVPVMQELPPDQRRTSHVFVRGSFLTPGEVVTPDTPSCWPPLPPDAPHNRLGLARWLVAADNPLTARVQANRIWEELFGRGLVSTSEDFGAQGEPPLEPALLDHLASLFVQFGWSRKQLLRTIVLSATYRQQSAASPELLQQDPYNAWFARGPRFRLSAEQLRDQALFVAGLLTDKVGGPSVMPAQPDGIWQQIYSGLSWQTSPGEDAHRRSLYTMWRRTSPHPTMTTFDAPSREYCVLHRVRTNTPLQALVTWNDPQFVECATALARATAAAATGDEARVEHLFRRCLLRAPTTAERDRLLRFYRDERQGFAADPRAAQALGGDADLAALTLLANVVLNLDEFLNKG